MFSANAVLWHRNSQNQTECLSGFFGQQISLPALAPSHPLAILSLLYPSNLAFLLWDFFCESSLLAVGATFPFTASHVAPVCPLFCLTPGLCVSAAYHRTMHTERLSAPLGTVASPELYSIAVRGNVSIFSLEACFFPSVYCIEPTTTPFST